MDKPAALSDEQLKYCEDCLRHRWPWTPHKYGLIASLVAMARERNTLLAEKAAKQQEAQRQLMLGAC